MTAIPNHALAQLRAGKLAIGMGVSQARTVAIAQIAETAGFDWLFIDCEHSSMDLDTATQISTAALAVGVTPWCASPASGTGTPRASTGCGSSIARCVRGSTTGTMSVESSGEPYTGPLGLTRGLRRSVDTTSCR